MPGLIIHGGAGKARTRAGCEAIAEALRDIANDSWGRIMNGETALGVATHATVLLEDNPLFNAGVGSKLQCDGGARLSAALMDGVNERFSGVVNVEGILNPILLCAALQTERDRVLCGTGAKEKARGLGLREGDPRTEEAIRRWKDAIEGETGTVGAVVLDTAGHIAAATSTGGRGMEMVGRVSDSCTVAGNYASSTAGVSCTGIGEDIVDGALAVRLVTAVESGSTLQNAARELTERMERQHWKAGLIGMSDAGEWTAVHTTEIMYWYAIDTHGQYRFEHRDG